MGDQKTKGGCAKCKAHENTIDTRLAHLEEHNERLLQSHGTLLRVIGHLYRYKQHNISDLGTGNAYDYKEAYKQDPQQYQFDIARTLVDAMRATQ